LARIIACAAWAVITASAPKNSNGERSGRAIALGNAARNSAGTTPATPLPAQETGAHAGRISF
jgi:hypothetical protein